MEHETVSVLAAGSPLGVLGPDLLSEAQRQLDICNACRYCEGLCAVFPALERRSVFHERDVLFFANLCHDCRDCFDVCPYATPHEFKVDVPPLLARVREETYAGYARPRMLGRALLGSSITRASWSALAVAAVVVLGVLTIGSDRLFATESGPGSFYEVVPFATMTVPAFLLSGLAVATMLLGIVRFWKDTANRGANLSSLARSLRAAFTLENMRGGGPGCTYPDESPRHGRRAMHGLVFYGFVGTFLATILAALWQEMLGRLPPYPILSPPVLVGLLGGVATIAGCIGLLLLKARSRTELSRPGILTLDRDFIVFLLLINGTGLALLFSRTTAAMGFLLLVHLALIAAFFLMLPYGKFVHATYRTAALLQDALEVDEERRSR